MGDDIEVVVEPPEVPVQELPSAAEMWHQMLQANHSEHMAHMDTLRAEFAALFESLSQRLSDLETRMIIEESSDPVIVEGVTMDEALETVETVGEVIADISQAVNQPDVETAPASEVHQENDNTARSDNTEVEPDTGGEPNSLAPPANGNGNRRSRFW